MRKKRNFLFFEILKNGIFRTIFTFLSVCLRATEDTFWPRNLIFGLKGPWDMRKKRNFLFFEILKNVIFRAIFTQKVCVRATEHTFWPRNLIFGLKDPWDMRKKRIFLFFEIMKNDIFRVIFVFHFRVCLFPSYRGHGDRRYWFIIKLSFRYHLG